MIVDDPNDIKNYVLLRQRNLGYKWNTVSPRSLFFDQSKIAFKTNIGVCSMLFGHVQSLLPVIVNWITCVEMCSLLDVHVHCGMSLQPQPRTTSEQQRKTSEQQTTSEQNTGCYAFCTV